MDKRKIKELSRRAFIRERIRAKQTTEYGEQSEDSSTVDRVEATVADTVSTVYLYKSNLSHGETNYEGQPKIKTKEYVMAQSAKKQSQSRPMETRRRLAKKKAINETVHMQCRQERLLLQLKAAVKRSASQSAQAMLAYFGGLLVVIMPMLVLLGAVSVMFGGSADVESAPVSDEVKSYAGLIQLYAEEHGIPEYAELIMAVMMQESCGLGNDPMQASESGFNTEYPRTAGGITDPEYSINVGIQALADCLNRAGVESPLDIGRISLALQGYNFGSGYISWAQSNYSGYSQENAIEFSQTMADRLGWSSYGDPYYVSHVGRYYELIIV